MKTQLSTSIRKRLFYAILLLSGLTLSSYRSTACVSTFTTAVAPNGHYTFTNTSVGNPVGTAYMWKTGDNNLWQFGNPTLAHTYTANGTYNVILWASDSSYCNKYDTVAITVTNVTNPCLLSASFTYTVAPHGVVNFTSTSSGTNVNTKYYWKPGDNNQRVLGTSTYTHTYLYQGSYYVWLVLIDTGNIYTACKDSVEYRISVPTADSSNCHIHASFTYTVGVNGAVSFTNTSTGAQSYPQLSWTFGDTTGTFQTYANTYAHNYSYSDTYTVKLKVVDSLCSDSTTATITITNACNLVANFTTTYDSSGQAKFTSTSSGTNAGTIYKWTFGDLTPTVTGHDTITHAYSFLGSYNVTLWDSNAGGCGSSVTKTIYIYNKDSLLASYSFFRDSLNNLTYYFYSTSKGVNANVYYKWNPGDTTGADSAVGLTNYNHTYHYAGSHTVTLTIWYTILPHKPLVHGAQDRFDVSSCDALINIGTSSSGSSTGNITYIVSLTQGSESYTIYPNPNNGSFRIAINGLAQEKDAIIRISNMMGQVVYQSNATVKAGNSTNDISLPGVANGIYLLQVITSSNTYTSRIAIQK